MKHHIYGALQPKSTYGQELLSTLFFLGRQARDGRDSGLEAGEATLNEADCYTAPGLIADLATSGP